MLTRRYRGYDVAEDGRVFKNGKELKGHLKGEYLSFGAGENEFKVHRILPELFRGENTKGKAVHHIDGNKLNNHIDNLKVMSQTRHKSMHRKEQVKHMQKRVKMIAGDLEHIFESVQDAGRKTGTNPPDISKVCRGKRNYAGTVKTPDGRKIKIKWKYVED